MRGKVQKAGKKIEKTEVLHTNHSQTTENNTIKIYQKGNLDKRAPSFKTRNLGCRSWSHNLACSTMLSSMSLTNALL